MRISGQIQAEIMAFKADVNVIQDLCTEVNKAKVIDPRPRPRMQT